MAAPGTTGSHETKSSVIRSYLAQPRDETLKRVAILMITNVAAQIANRIQKPPSGAGFFRGG